jgi:hypothetical protein
LATGKVVGRLVEDPVIPFLPPGQNAEHSVTFVVKDGRDASAAPSAASELVAKDVGAGLVNARHQYRSPPVIALEWARARSVAAEAP